MSGSRNAVVDSVALAVLQANLTRLEGYLEEKFKTTERAVAIALDANNTRLDGMNEFRTALNDQTNRMITRVEALAAVQAVDSRAINEIGEVRNKVEAQTRPNYILMTSILSATFVLITGIWLVIGLKIESATTPLAISVTQLVSAQLTRTQQIEKINADLLKLQSDSATEYALASQTKTLVGQLGERMNKADGVVAESTAERRSEVANLSTRVTRLDTWLGFVHSKLFGDGTAVPLQQSAP